MINDRYKIIRKIGEGRSKVYLCEDILRMGKKLAIKILSPSSDNNEKKSFRDEYFLLKKLDHPNIIRVFEYSAVVSLDEEDSQYNISSFSTFFTLEYFEGSELYEFNLLEKEDLLADIICQISSVLYYLHQSSYVYYDLKSENILVREDNRSPVIKFIDFGLAVNVKFTEEISARGTAEYIAPEILRKEAIDHRVDLYSFGILLYRIIYGKFPFRNNDQLSIYKAHLDQQFEFPDTSYSEKIIRIIKNLLSKDAGKRFYTSIGIINEINPSAIKKYKNDWIRIPNFSGRRDSLSIVSTYIEKQNGGEVLSVKGAEGAGKSTLLDEINYKYPQSLMVSADQNIDYGIWQALLREILYRQDIYANLQPEIISEAKSILNGNSTNLVEDLKAIIIKLISAGRFILLVDNFNHFSNFDLEIFLQLIPVLQISKIKIVLTEDSSYEYNSNAINNLQSINLNPLTEIQVSEFVNDSFADFCPRDKIKKAVILYSDVLPGSIEIFLKDLIVLDILKFTPDGPLLEINENLDQILKGSHEDIYRYRINNLDAESRDMAILLSLFNINLDTGTIIKLTDGFSRQKISELLVKLSESNIIHYNPVLGVAQFTSQGVKEYLCATVEDFKEAHLKIAELITKKIPYFNKNELARHWEIAGKYEQTYATLKEELNKARSTSALAYERNLLEHLSSLPLEYNSARNINIALSKCLFQIGELNASISLLNKLLDNTRSAEEELSLKILKGKALIASQSVKEGQTILESILNKIDRNEIRNEMLSEIAEAEYEMAKYEEAEKLADQLIADRSTSIETSGKIYRIKALLELFKNNNPEGTIEFLNKALGNFQKVKQLAKVASMHNNLGNIYNIVGERNLAEENWNRALSVNNSIGNLLQNAIILLNFGIYYLESCNYEKAVEYYLEALSFFKTLGDKNNLGITYINMGEAYIILCEYEKAIEVLEAAVDIFKGLDNNLEKGEAEFLLGRLYFQVGDDKSLSKIIESYTGYKDLHLDKLDFNYKYLKVLRKILVNESSTILEELFSLREVSKVQSDNLIFCDIQVKIIECMIVSQKYREALRELISDDFKNICGKNLYFNSYRDYLMGKVTESENIQEPKPYLSYYEDAFNKISSISITELTWKILDELARIYKDRGILSRSSEYEKYARQTLLYIVEQIKSARLKKIYLNNPERKKVLSRPENI